MTTNPKHDPREYYFFYLIGRRDDELECQADLTALAERVLAGEAIRAVCMRVAMDAATAAQHAGHKRDWLLSNKAEIAEAGGNEERAYSLYLDGQQDELASNLEPEILGEVMEILDDLDIMARVDDDDRSEADDPDEDDEVGRVV